MSEQVYLDLLQDILDNGIISEDRTGVGTISVFGRQIRFDLSESFPLFTTKAIPWKAVASELLWFIEGTGDERRLAEIRYGKPADQLVDKKTIWTANAEAPYWKDKAAFPGDLGRVYGTVWRAWPANSKVTLIDKKKHIEEEPFVVPEYMKKIKINYTDSDLDGQEFTASDGTLWKVVGRVDTVGTKNSTLLIEHQDGVQIKVSRPNLKTAGFCHPYLLKVRGVACLGKTVNRDKRLYYTRAYDLWNALIARCYDKNHPSYSQYGGAGVTVAPEWKCFELFFKSLPKVLGFYKWATNTSDQTFSLDKDYFGSKSYSEKTCIFLDQKDNTSFGSECVDNSGELYTSISAVGNRFSVPSNTIQNRLALDGFWRHTETGIEVRPYEVPVNKVVRPIWYIDQLAELIEGIKRDPNGRRHILTAWEPGELNNVALPPCHVLSQFYVRKGKLSCMLFQRSGDAFLGVPFNVASYALLTTVVATACGLELGEFVHTLGDAHIYSNHVDAVKEQLARDVRPAPKLVLNPNITDIDAFTMDDFTIHDYDPHEAIKVEMAV